MFVYAFHCSLFKWEFRKHLRGLQMILQNIFLSFPSFRFRCKETNALLSLSLDSMIDILQCCQKDITFLLSKQTKETYQSDNKNETREGKIISEYELNDSCSYVIQVDLLHFCFQFCFTQQSPRNPLDKYIKAQIYKYCNQETV